MPAFRHGATALLVGLALLAAALPAAAQLTESRIIGEGHRRERAVLPGVTVTVTSTQTGAVRTAVTDAGGVFTVTNLGPGSYTVLFSLDGFAPSESAVTLGVGDTKPANASLGIASVSETVNVSAESRVLDVQGAKIGVNVSPEEVQNLPVNGRNFANLMTLATGATTRRQRRLVVGAVQRQVEPAELPELRRRRRHLRLGRQPRLPERHRIAVPPADVDGVGRRVPRRTPAWRRPRAASAPAATSRSSPRAAATRSAARPSGTGATTRSTRPASTTTGSSRSR